MWSTPFLGYKFACQLPTPFGGALELSHHAGHCGTRETRQEALKLRHRLGSHVSKTNIWAVMVYTPVFSMHYKHGNNVHCNLFQSTKSLKTDSKQIHFYVCVAQVSVGGCRSQKALDSRKWELQKTVRERTECWESNLYPLKSSKHTRNCWATFLVSSKGSEL